MNAVTASFIAQVGPTYDVHQVAMLLLNSLVFLPCCLIAGRLALARRGRRRGCCSCSSPPARWWCRTSPMRGPNFSRRSA